MTTDGTPTGRPSASMRRTRVDEERSEVRRLIAGDGLGPVESEQLRFALARVVRWVLLCGDTPTTSGGNAGRGKDPGKAVVARFIALVWTMDPEYFDGRPSLRELATRFRTHRSTLSRHAARASRDFRIVNREQVETRKRTHKPSENPKRNAPDAG